MATNSSLDNVPDDCATHPVGLQIFSFFMLSNLLLLPLSMFILYLGFHQWRRRRSISHLDHFTYHMAAMEVIPACGSIIYNVGFYYDNVHLLLYGRVLFSPNWSAKVHFNSFTCVEHYLAVVHPILYLGLKRRGGAKVRNVSIGFLWLLAFFWTILHLSPQVTGDAEVGIFMFSLSVALVIIAYCNISVLWVLVRSSPAKGGGTRVKVDQSKRRAFQTVAVIFGALVFAAVGLMTIEIVNVTGGDDNCIILNAGAWFSLPCSWVLPLLYLHRSARRSSK